MRLKQLDTVRAFAIGLVMIEHYGGKGVNALFPIGAGSMGVGCFFVLSGFLITSSLLVDADSKGGTSVAYYRNFYIRRALRLLPAFYLWLAILCVFQIEPVAQSWMWHAAYLSNVWISLGHPILDFWSLSVEEQFYLLWPLLIAFAPRKHLLWIVFGATICGSALFKGVWEAAGHNGNTIQTLLFANMTELGCGSMLAICCYRGKKAYDFSWYTPRAHAYFSGLSALCLLEAISMWLLVGKAGPYRYYINDAICAVPCVWLILNAAIGFRGAAGKVFDNPILQYVGRISYALYLTHNFVPKILVKVIGPMPRWEMGLLSLIITFVLCSLSWRYFERPILGLKRHFEPRGKAGIKPQNPETDGKPNVNELATGETGRAA